jgi:hypothetical protein
MRGDMLAPPFADDTFDLVWVVNAVNHWHDPVAGVRILSTKNGVEGKNGASSSLVG